jgi:hypothetical protein
MLAAYCGFADVAHILILNGANVNITSNVRHFLSQFKLIFL